MSKTVSYILGLSILVGSGLLFKLVGKDVETSSPEAALLCLGLIASMGLAHAVMHQGKYPVKAISIIIAAIVVISLMFGGAAWELVLADLVGGLIVPGVIFILVGSTLRIRR